MIIVFIKTKLIPEKRKEFFQTIQAIRKKIIKSKGCINFNIYSEVGKDRAYCIVEEWRSQKDIDQHFKSDIFTVLMGALNLLGEKPLVTVSNEANIINDDITKASNAFFNTATV
jgi:quinol monooxygenase YgiN